LRIDKYYSQLQNWLSFFLAKHSSENRKRLSVFEVGLVIALIFDIGFEGG